MPDTLIFRRYDGACRESMFQLYEEVYGREKGRRWRKSWEWEYERNPCLFGKVPVWTAVTGERVVGLVSTIPAVARWRGRTVRTSWFVDLLTHPDWRGRGIFARLTELMISDEIGEGTSVFLVFPNDASGPLLRKRGWSDIITTPGMIKTLRLLPLLRRLGLRDALRIPAFIPIAARQLLGRRGSPAGYSGGAPIRVREIDSFDDRFDRFINLASETFDFIVLRDARFLNWRYVACPHRDYTILLAEDGDELLGYIVVAAGPGPGTRGYIVDFLTKPGGRRRKATSLLVCRAVKQVREAGGSSIELSAMGAPYDAVLESHGFSFMSGSAFRGYRLMGRLSGEAAAEDFAGTRRWFITRGDADSDIAMDS